MAGRALWAAVEIRNLDVRSGATENGVDRDAALRLIASLIDKGADVNARVKEFPPQRRYMLPLGSLEWVDFTGQTRVHPGGAVRRRAGDEAAPAEGRGPAHHHVQRHDRADGGRGRELGGRPDLQRIAGRWIEAVQLCLELGATSTRSTRWDWRRCTAPPTAVRTTSSNCSRSAARGSIVPDKEGRTPMTGRRACSWRRIRRSRSRRTIALLKRLARRATDGVSDEAKRPVRRRSCRVQCQRDVGADRCSRKRRRRGRRPLPRHRMPRSFSRSA